jgi:7-carboxy-7-deazaguanine synthase
VTGGEPLIQEETPLLIRKLIDKGFIVLLETNGSRDIGEVDDRCIRIMDIKCPSSGEEKNNDLDNLKKLTGKVEVKFVIGDRTDFDYAKGMISRIDKKYIEAHPPHFAPVFGGIAPHLLAQWILEDHLNARLSLQLHKILWDPEKRGV